MSRRAALAIALGALLVPGCDERPVLEWGVALRGGGKHAVFLRAAEAGGVRIGREVITRTRTLTLP